MCAPFVLGCHVVLCVRVYEFGCVSFVFPFDRCLLFRCVCNSARSFDFFQIIHSRFDIHLVTKGAKMDSHQKTGYSPHGTPVSSLGVTTSSSSAGQPVNRPAVPAMPAAMGSSASKPEAEDNPYRGVFAKADSPESDDIESCSSSSSMLESAKLKRLKLQAEYVKAELRLAEAQEEAAEKSSSRSGRTRSSRRVSRPSRSQSPSLLADLGYLGAKLLRSQAT